jgi:hypothetical protein
VLDLKYTLENSLVVLLFRLFDALVLWALVPSSILSDGSGSVLPVVPVRRHTIKLHLLGCGLFLLTINHRPVSSIWRRIRHPEKDQDLSARRALECTTMLFHRLLADRAQGHHRTHGVSTGAALLCFVR